MCCQEQRGSDSDRVTISCRVGSAGAGVRPSVSVRSNLWLGTSCGEAAPKQDVFMRDSPSTPRALHIDPVNNWLGVKHHCTITRFAVAVITHLWAIRLVCWPCFCSPDKKKKVAWATTRHWYLLLSPREPGPEKRIECVVIVQISVKKACPLCLCVHVCLMALRSLSAAAVVVHPETCGQCV